VAKRGEEVSQVAGTDRGDLVDTADHEVREEVLDVSPPIPHRALRRTEVLRTKRVVLVAESSQCSR